MKKRGGLPALVVAMVFLFVCANYESALGQSKPAPGTFPPFVVMVVNAAGGTLNVVGNGLAKMISEKCPFTVKLRSSSSGGLEKMVNDGDANLSVSVSVEPYNAIRGLDNFAGEPQKKLRLVSPGPFLLVGMIVKKGSPYQSVADLKGKKVAGKYVATRPIYFDGVALFAAANMKWEDVNVVPVGTLVEGIQSLIQGRTEAAATAVGSGLVQEANASLGGVRFIGVPGDSAAAKKMWDAVPGYSPVAVKAGQALGIDKDMFLGAKDIYVNSSVDTSPAVIYEITKAMWNHMGTLDPIHPLFKEWTKESMLKTRITIPYHEGSVRFFKEVGKWTPEIEQAQNGALKILGS
jgi:TRAP transporter TAXI family solute receptor